MKNTIEMKILKIVEMLIKKKKLRSYMVEFEIDVPQDSVFDEVKNRGLKDIIIL